MEDTHHTHHSPSANDPSIQVNIIGGGKDNTQLIPTVGGQEDEGTNEVEGVGQVDGDAHDGQDAQDAQDAQDGQDDHALDKLELTEICIKLIDNDKTDEFIAM